MPMGPAVCVTGHRPKGLPGGYQGDPVFTQFMDDIVLNYYYSGYKTFISGGAIGTDQIFAEAVIKLKNRGIDVELIIAQPFPSQASKWPDQSQQRFAAICQRADLVFSVCNDPYSPSKMQIRNEWMVDNAITVLAFWNGKKSGGTWNCVNYALHGRAIKKVVQVVHPFTYDIVVL